MEERGLPRWLWRFFTKIDLIDVSLLKERSISLHA